LQVKRLLLWAEASSSTSSSTTTSFAGGARNNAVPDTVDRLQNGSKLKLVGEEGRLYGSDGAAREGA
jgi:hypothetical protein